MSDRLARHLKESSARLQAQARALDQLEERLHSIFEPIAGPSVFECIENCRAREQVWALIERSVVVPVVPVYDRADVSERAYTSYFALLVGALLEGVYFACVNDDQTPVVSKNRVLPGHLALNDEAADGRFDGHKERNAPDLQPVQLIDLLHFILKHTECSDLTAGNIECLDRDVERAMRRCAQSEQCARGRCSHPQTTSPAEAECVGAADVAHEELQLLREARRTLCCVMQQPYSVHVEILSAAYVGDRQIVQEFDGSLIVVASDKEIEVRTEELRAKMERLQTPERSNPASGGTAKRSRK